MKPYVEKPVSLPTQEKLKVNDSVIVQFASASLNMAVIALSGDRLVVGGHGFAISFDVRNKQTGWDITQHAAVYTKGMTKGGHTVSFDDFTYREYAHTTEEVLVQPGERFSTANNDFVVEYICEDGSLVLKSTKKPRDGKAYNPGMTLVCVNDTRFSKALQNTRLVWK